MNAPELNTALHRVERVLQNSEQGLTIHRITQLAQVTEKEAQNSIKALHAMGQIEMIPTPGRWGNRYAWLSTKPVEVPAVLSAYRELVESQAVPLQPERYAVAVPKRPLRIVKSRERAEALALAAVRNGAKGAEVFALQPIGKAARGAEWRTAT